MRTEPIKPQPTFGGYNSVLKTLYKKGKLPQVKKGFYGDRLTKDNCSLEHLLCREQGGTTDLSNLVLASKRKNNARGNKPLRDFINLKAMADYLIQFKGIRRKGFNGDKYIKSILQTVSDLL